MQLTDRWVLPVVRHLDVHQWPGGLQLHLHVEHVGGDVALCARRGEVGAQPGSTKHRQGGTMWTKERTENVC